MSELDAHVWECVFGHEWAVLDKEIREMVFHPRCGRMIRGRPCMGYLKKKLRPLSQGAPVNLEEN